MQLLNPCEALTDRIRNAQLNFYFIKQWILVEYLYSSITQISYRVFVAVNILKNYIHFLNLKFKCNCMFLYFLSKSDPGSLTPSLLLAFFILVQWEHGRWFHKSILRFNRGTKYNLKKVMHKKVLLSPPFKISQKNFHCFWFWNILAFFHTITVFLLQKCFSTCLYFSVTYIIQVHYRKTENSEMNEVSHLWCSCSMMKIMLS